MASDAKVSLHAPVLYRVYKFENTTGGSIYLELIFCNVLIWGLLCVCVCVCVLVCFTCLRWEAIVAIESNLGCWRLTLAVGGLLYPWGATLVFGCDPSSRGLLQSGATLVVGSRVLL